MDVINIESFDDGSGWSAVVKVRGVMFVASYVANQLSVRKGQYKYPPHAPKWAADHVRKWADKQLATMPADWFEKHRALYA